MQGQTLLKTLLCLLVIVGAINWGYIAITRNCEEDLVNALLPAGYSVYVYAAVGVAGLLLAGLYLYKQRGMIEKGRYAVDKAVSGVKEGVQRGYSAVKKAGKKITGK